MRRNDEPTMSITITSDTEANAAFRQLVDTQDRMTELDANQAELDRKIGDALAAGRLGSVDAKAEAARLQAKRSMSDAERHDLRLTEIALQGALKAWEAGADDRALVIVEADRDRIAARARLLEGRYLELRRDERETEEELDQLRWQWQRTTRSLAELGGSTAGHKPPSKPKVIKPHLGPKPGERVGRFRPIPMDEPTVIVTQPLGRTG